ncbi:MAG TPA: DUF748 domain-containing protein [Steroidobacteraceae bacterium]|nr:DUF748 domain-containing protein [Steroidobacteraceae bacterium]
MPAVRGRRYLVILAVLAGLLGAYAAAGFILVPRWLRSELVGLTARDYGRTLSLGEVRFDPFTWALQIRDFSLPDADGKPMVTFGRLEVGVGLSSVWHLTPSLRYVVLDGPQVSAVVRRDGRLNLADLAKPFARPTPATTPGTRPFELSVERLVVRQGSATYEDDSRPKPFRLELDPIAFQLLNFSTTGNTAGSYRLTATIGRRGKLDWSGSVRARPMSVRGTISLDALSARMVGDYLGPLLPAQISRGAVSLQGSFAIAGAPAGAPGDTVRMTIDLPRAQVSRLGVRPWGATSDVVAVERFELGNTRVDLEHRAIRIGRISIAGADVRGWIDRSGRLNLLQLLGHSGKAAAAAPVAPGVPPSAAAPAWRIAAPEIRVEDARVSLQDRSVAPAADLTLDPLSARITGYGDSPQSRIAVSLQSAVDGKGQLRLTAAGNLGRESLKASLDLRRIDLRPLQPYLSEYSALTLVSGSLDSKLDIDRQADGRLSAAGRIDIAHLRTLDESRRSFVKWQGLHIVGLRYVSRPASLRVERIVAVAPYARVIIGPHHTLNVSEALHPRGWRAATAAASTAPAKPAQAGRKSATRSGSASMPMTIGLVRIANGTADFSDLSVKPNFATGIQDLHGTVKGLSSAPGSRAIIALRGDVDRTAPVDITGEANPLSAASYADVRMKFRGLELTRMTPYAVRFAGYEIASGTLDANLHYEVHNGRLNADHRLVVRQLQLGKRVESPHAIDLPLRLAVALLKDANGVIRIGLPVTGSLNDPKFSLGPLVGKALLHVLKMAVTAPFTLLGRLFGGGPDMNRFAFVPGSAALRPDARARAAALAKALAQRPQLSLQVPAVFAPEVDRRALAQRRLRTELLALSRSGSGAPRQSGRAGRSPGGTARPPAGPEALELPVAHYRLLRAAYRNTFGPKAPLPAAAEKVPPFEPAIHALQSALLERMQVPQSELQALAERRAQAIRSAIVAAGGFEPSRVAIAAAAAQHAKDGQVVVQLGLK